jgi:hypothetical protein
MTPIDPALTICVAHERRRHAPLPPIRDLADDALAIVRAEESRRASNASPQEISDAV